MAGTGNAGRAPLRAGHALVVLYETNIADKAFEVALREAFEEITARVGEDARLNNQQSFNICSYDLHKY